MSTDGHFGGDNAAQPDEAEVESPDDVKDPE
jgi:hypothetical protein